MVAYNFICVMREVKFFMKILIKIVNKIKKQRLLIEMMMPAVIFVVLAGVANLTVSLFNITVSSLEPEAVPTFEYQELTAAIPEPSGFWQSVPKIIATPTPESSSLYEQEPLMPEIPIDAYVTPPEGMGQIEQMTITPSFNGRTVAVGSGYLQNYTHVTAEDIIKATSQTPDLPVEINSELPQVLIYHTHATECYAPEDLGYYDPSLPNRSTDPEKNMLVIGEIMTEVLNTAGINTIQDRTMHDEYSYNGSYDSSAENIKKYLEMYPSIKIVIDVHRDALERQDGTRLKPVAMVNGVKTAQIMLISGVDDGTMGMPNYMENLEFAADWQSAMESLYPGLTRSILFDYRNYNQELSTGALLLEVGGHANTLQEAKRAAEFSANALAQLIFSGFSME